MRIDRNVPVTIPPRTFVLMAVWQSSPFFLLISRQNPWEPNGCPLPVRRPIRSSERVLSPSGTTCSSPHFTDPMDQNDHQQSRINADYECRND